MKRFAYISIVLLLLAVAQTETAIDLTPIVSILYTILPFILIIMVISIVFGLLGDLLKGLGRVFSFVKPKLSAPLVSAVLLVAQTTTTTSVDLSQAVGLASSLIYVILPVVLMVAVLGFVMKLLSSIPNMLR